MKDYWAIVCRRRWWIFLPIFLCWAVVWTGGWLWPASYESEGTILVQQQQVPEQYVAPNVTLDLEDRVQSMTQQILSRTRLQATINRFHLYRPSHGLSSLFETGDPVDQMRKDIKIELVESDNKTGVHRGELTAFKIHYSAPSPELAQQVNSELTSLFIDENLRAQQQLSESTTAFLDAQLADARTKLEEQEAQVRAFKAKHMGDLPSQLESNVQILSGLQSQLETTERALDGAKQQNLYLESLQQQYQSAQGTDLRLELSDLRSKYTDDYPDIIALKEKIAKSDELKKQIEAQIVSNQKTKNATNSLPGNPGIPGQPGSETPVMQIESQLKANQLEIQNYTKRQKELESQIAAYQARLNMTPETEQQLADISRGYEESKSNYKSLLEKQNQSQLATSLEQRQQGEQFSIIDPPSLPDKPSSPNHILVSLGGLVVGTIIGFGLALLMELADVRVRQEKDLERHVRAHVLVGIPHLNAPGEDRLRARARRMEIAAAVGMVILIVAGNLYSFYKG
ncbi:MAG: GNVR domain-containing protein [Candidatus Acidiferrales bacterium]